MFISDLIRSFDSIHQRHLLNFKETIHAENGSANRYINQNTIDRGGGIPFKQNRLCITVGEGKTVM